MGIEIPNQKEEVYFGDIVNDQKFTEDQNSLTLALGKIYQEI